MVEALPVIEITLDTKLEDILDGTPCMVCGYPTEKFLAPDHLMTGQSMRVRALNVASYRCSRRCGKVYYYSHEALIESLTRGAEIMRQNGDDVAPHYLRGSIRIQKKDLKNKRLGRPRNIL
ncbi:MAG: hypothetical protein Q7S44_02910 [bacterium]|nr:hypothetical protein [bacterium]